MRVRRWGFVISLIVIVGMVSGCGLFNAAPVVSFSWSPQDPLARSDVQFSDLSTDAGGVAWRRRGRDLAVELRGWVFVSDAASEASVRQGRAL